MSAPDVQIVRVEIILAADRPAPEPSENELRAVLEHIGTAEPKTETQLAEVPPMSTSDRQLGQPNLILTDATGKSAIEPEDRAIREMLDASIAQESASAPTKCTATISNEDQTHFSHLSDEDKADSRYWRSWFFGDLIPSRNGTQLEKFGMGRGLPWNKYVNYIKQDSLEDDVRQHMLKCPADVSPEDWFNLIIDSRFFEEEEKENAYRKISGDYWYIKPEETGGHH